MLEQNKLIVSHAPFWHSGSRVTERSYHTMLAALPAVIAGIVYYGVPVIGVVGLSIASAMLWELAINKVMKKAPSIGDGSAALTGLLLAMVLPATMPWWAVVTGTFIAVVIGKHIFGGIGSNAFHPVALAVAIMMISWKDLFDFNGMLLNYDFNFPAVYPLTAAKNFGTLAIESFSVRDLMLGRQMGALGSTFGLGLIIGGLYLMIRGFIRWEISLSFIAGVYLTALLFNIADPVRFAGPGFHIFTGYTLIGAVFLATDDSSSPVWFVPMLIYGAVGGIMTVLIRNIGAYVDGVILAVLVGNLISPLLDKIRPKALGKAV
ncbi:MAG: RnfABCDGE type electron transport complex subunit D [Desulfobacterales bacterium]